MHNTLPRHLQKLARLRIKKAKFLTRSPSSCFADTKPLHPVFYNFAITADRKPSKGSTHTFEDGTDVVPKRR